MADHQTNDAYKKALQERGERQAYYSQIIENAVKRVLAQHRGSEPPMKMYHFYGALGIDPKHLVLWYFFKTDAEWHTAQENGLTHSLEEATYQELSAGRYPSEALPGIHIGFVSVETVDAAGGYRAYFA